jgi:hypothetical protein
VKVIPSSSHSKYERGENENVRERQVDLLAMAQWAAAGLSAGGGWKLVDVFVLRRPHQNAVLDRAIRDELREDNRLLRAENKKLRKQAAKQAARMAEFAQHEQAVVARLLTAGVDAAVVAKIIKRSRARSVSR